MTVGSNFHERERPPRSIYVREFDIAHVPVTVNQYAAFLNSGAVEEERWWGEMGWAWLHDKLDKWGRENCWQPDAWKRQRKKPFHPVVGITWYEATAYCAWVSYEQKRSVRLPSEVEWEYAARGDDERPFPWGEEYDPALTNNVESGLHDITEAGKTAGDVSPYGILDMAGNVQEWTNSDYKPYPGEIYASDYLFVARGGSYNDTAFGARTSYRRAYPPGYFFPFLGFRVVIDIR